MPQSRSIAWPIASTSYCAARVQRCSRISCRGTDPMIGKLDYLQTTPSQTAGPYVHIGLIPQQAGFEIFENPLGNVIAGRNTPGERIRIEGRVLDALGSPCRDVLVELWQANAAGRYNHPTDQQTDKPIDPEF